MCDPSLKRLISQLSSSTILVDGDHIRPGDETALLQEEARSIASRVIDVRRASGAVRVLGRSLLIRLGYDACAIPKGASGAPVWPTGVVGSFAHDDAMAVAAVGRSRDVGAVGIDVEPGELLPDELRDLVTTARERGRLADDPCAGRLIFAAKEAVYKAVAMLEGTALDYQDIEIDLAGRQALLRNGRVISLRYCAAAQLVVLAFIPKTAALRS